VFCSYQFFDKAKKLMNFFFKIFFFLHKYNHQIENKNHLKKSLTACSYFFPIFLFKISQNSEKKSTKQSPIAQKRKMGRGKEGVG